MRRLVGVWILGLLMVSISGLAQQPGAAPAQGRGGGTATAGPSTPSKPNFSGTWTLTSEESLSPIPMPVVPGAWQSPFTIAQTGNAFSVRFVFSGETIKEDYTLDGAEHRINSTDATSAAWKDNTIVIVLSHDLGFAKTDIVRMLSMDGNRLIVTSTSKRDVREMPISKNTYTRAESQTPPPANPRGGVIRGAINPATGR